MVQRITARKAGQLFIGSAIMLLAMGATGVSGWLNVSYGLKFNLTIAIVFGLSDAALFTIPPAATFLGRSRYLRIAFAICAVTSVWTASNSLFDGQWQRFVAVEHEAGQQDDLRDQVERLKKGLLAIDEQASVKALGGLLDATTGARRDECSEEAGGRGPECRKLEAEEREIRARKGLAERRDRLSARLDAAREALDDVKPVADVGIAEERIVITTVLALMLLEVLRHFNVAGLYLIRLALRKPRTRAKNRGPAPHPSVVGGNVVPITDLQVSRAERGMRNLTGT